jgi:hypothetical protein
MKKIILLIMLITLASCGDSQVIQGKNCGTYGFFESKPRQCVQYDYRVVPGNIVWSIVLSASIVPPLLILGLDMWEPVPQSQQPPYALKKQ